MLTPNEKETLAALIAQAETKTKAELVLVIAKASDAYQSNVLLYGLALGSVIDIALWYLHWLTSFPLLLMIQLGVTALLSLVPVLAREVIRFIPKHVTHHRASHRAYEEYQRINHLLPAGTPIALLYISLAERYAHMLTSRDVREKIPEATWDAIISEFTNAARVGNVGAACIQAMTNSADVLIADFPQQGAKHTAYPNIIEA